MTMLETVTFDQILVSAMAVIMLREAMIAFLPLSVVGPEGWLIRTDFED